MFCTEAGQDFRSQLQHSVAMRNLHNQANFFKILHDVVTLGNQPTERSCVVLLYSTNSRALTPCGL